MKRFLIAAAVIGLASCGTDAPPPPAPQPPKAAPPTPPAINPANDLCRSRDFVYLIGRPRTEIPVPVQTYPPRRVTCTTCPVTMDYNAARLNILFDEATGIIREVKCG